MVKKKILFWIDWQTIHFGIAKFLQEKDQDSEIFAIYDINNITSNFYKTQKLVNFKKTWFLRENIIINNSVPDIKYLKEFEKKYKINLWMIAYTERRFHLHNKYYKFSYNEILSIIEQECKLLEKILDEVKPDVILMKVTDHFSNYLLKQLCKSIGIKILMLGMTRFGFKNFIASDYDNFGNVKKGAIIDNCLSGSMCNGK